MRVLLPLLSEAARAEVLAAKTPLGAILARHGIELPPLSGRLLPHPLESPD